MLAEQVAVNEDEDWREPPAEPADDQALEEERANVPAGLRTRIDRPAIGHRSRTEQSRKAGHLDSTISCR
jgi:hypothetical protein